MEASGHFGRHFQLNTIEHRKGMMESYAEQDPALKHGGKFFPTIFKRFRSCPNAWCFRYVTVDRAVVLDNLVFGAPHRRLDILRQHSLYSTSTRPREPLASKTPHAPSDLE